MPLQIALLRPPVFVARRSLSYYGAVPPLGLAYIAAAARGAGHAVSVVDAAGEALHRLWDFPRPGSSITGQGLDPEAILERLPARCDVIGVTCMFLHEWPFVRQLLPLIKRRRPEARLVLGGETPSGFGARVFEDAPVVDAVVRGEGEQAFLAYLAELEAGRDGRGVPGVIVRAGAELVDGGPGERIRDVDALPWPAWDLLPVEAYLAHGSMSGVDRGRSMPLLSSRGCPYECSFCSSPGMWTTRYKARSPERVVDEIEDLMRRYRVRNLDFYDLTAVLTRNWAERFHAEVRARGLEFTWQLPQGTRSEALDRPTLELLHATGCRNLAYAIESSSTHILERMKKRIDVEAAVASVRDALDVGIVAHANLILGFPGESRRDHLSYLRFTIRLAWAGVYGLSPMIFSPYPGSAEYERLRARGEIDPSSEDYLLAGLLRASRQRRTSYHARFSTPQLFAVQLALVICFYAVQYLRRPQRVLKTIANLFRGEQQSVLDQFLVVRLRRALAGRERGAGHGFAGAPLASAPPPAH